MIQCALVSSIHAQLPPISLTYVDMDTFLATFQSSD